MSMKSSGRHELKFFIDGHEKREVLERLEPGLVPDQHGQAGVYRITSLYYDTPSLRAFHEKLDGVNPRHKFRLRYYGDQLPESGFFEVKSRHYQLIHKLRVPVDGQTFEQLVSCPERLRDFEGMHGWVEGLAFVHLQACRAPMAPTAVTSYRREAYVSRFDPTLRVTFDHLCQAFSPQQFPPGPDDVGPPLCPSTHVLMEVKFNHRLPGWIRDAVVGRRLRAVRFSKYCEAVFALGSHPMRRRLAAVNSR
ncbi:MAG: polyphosphate polymerase domain-containing protein [Candidatus Eremiobacteraeota bacterium]|nr:polyphosphate polymerase domain-containing protein [Candidatus Eremiobacteraeota bacterium]